MRSEVEGWTGAMKVTINISKLSALKKLAVTLSSACEAGDVVLLKGDLGAGKTTFARYFIQNLCSSANVTSPTFNLVNIYKSDAGPIYHYDLYRLTKAEETNELAMDDAFKHGITLIEWPEHVEDIAFPNKIVIYFLYDTKQNVRTAIVELHGKFSKL